MVEMHFRAIHASQLQVYFERGASLLIRIKHLIPLMF